MCRLLPGNQSNEFAKSGLDLVLEASHDYSQMSLSFLKERLGESLMETRKTLVAPQARISSSEDTAILKDLNSRLLTDVTEQIRGKSYLE